MIIIYSSALYFAQMKPETPNRKKLYEAMGPSVSSGETVTRACP
mgnify:CR=1 FL=1|jgi:hypothetical protein